MDIARIPQTFRDAVLSPEMIKHVPSTEALLSGSRLHAVVGSSKGKTTIACRSMINAMIEHPGSTRHTAFLRFRYARATDIARELSRARWEIDEEVEYLFRHVGFLIIDSVQDIPHDMACIYQLLSERSDSGRVTILTSPREYYEAMKSSNASFEARITRGIVVSL